MTELHPSVALIAHLSGQVAGYAFTSPDGRYQAAEVGGDTVIVDLREQRQHRAAGVYPRGFHGVVLEVEGEETATAYLPTWTDLQQISLEQTSADFWSPWPDPRGTGLSPLPELQTSERTPVASEATAQVQRPADGWVAWLFALLALALFALFGFNAIAWALAREWHRL